MKSVPCPPLPVALDAGMCLPVTWTGACGKGVHPRRRQRRCSMQRCCLPSVFVCLRLTQPRSFTALFVVV